MSKFWTCHQLVICTWTVFLSKVNFLCFFKDCWLRKSYASIERIIQKFINCNRYKLFHDFIALLKSNICSVIFINGIASNNRLTCLLFRVFPIMKTQSVLLFQGLEDNPPFWEIIGEPQGGVIVRKFVFSIQSEECCRK